MSWGEYLVGYVFIRVVKGICIYSYDEIKVVDDIVLYSYMMKGCLIGYV